MKILKSIGVFFLSLLIFYVVYAICAFISLFIAEIPLLGNLFFHSDEQPMHWAPIMMSAAASYLATSGTINSLLKEHSDRLIPRRILGTILVMLNAWFLIINLTTKEASIFANLVFVIVGLVFIFRVPNYD